MLKVVVASVLVVSGVFAFSDAIAKEAVRTAGDVAKAAINKNKVEVTMKNTELKNNVNLEEAASIGNSGISIKGDKVNLTDTKIKNNVKMKRAISWGNSGVEVGR